MRDSARPAKMYGKLDNNPFATTASGLAVTAAYPNPNEEILTRPARSMQNWPNFNIPLTRNVDNIGTCIPMDISVHIYVCVHMICHHWSGGHNDPVKRLEQGPKDPVLEVWFQAVPDPKP